MVNDKMKTENNKDFTIAVVMAAYNAEDTIERSIKSILAQTRQVDEIIVVNDGSTDSTEAKVKSFGDKVICITQSNAGPGAGRNTGIKAARSKWISFLDADDEWLPENIEKQASLLHRNSELMWSSGNFIRCLCAEDRKGPELEPERAKLLIGGKDYFGDYFFAFRNLAGGWTGTMIVRRDVFDEVGFFAEEHSFAEDIDLWWRIAWRHSKTGFVTDPIAIYHLPAQPTLSQENRSSHMAILCPLLDKHLEIARSQGSEDRFKPVVSFLVTAWIRGLLFRGDKENICMLISNYGYSLNLGFKLFVTVLMVFPRFTANGCHVISKIVRALKLRKKIVRRP